MSDIVVLKTHGKYGSSVYRVGHIMSIEEFDKVIQDSETYEFLYLLFLSEMVYYSKTDAMKVADQYADICGYDLGIYIREIDFRFKGD